MNLLNDLPELVRSNVITPETADRIAGYYRAKKNNSGNRIFTIFGALGAILVGLGIILIIAHNWDDLSQGVRTALAFLPLLTGQALCGFTLLKKPDHAEWREGSAAFLFIAVGASISLVAQIYNISGDLPAFILTWMLLCLPLVYLMKSSIASLFYLFGITFYACEMNYWDYDKQSDLHWLLFALALPHYYYLYKNRPGSNFMALHNWLVPTALVIILGTLGRHDEEWLFVAYFSLFGLFYLIGSFGFFKMHPKRNNDLLTLGSLGTIVLLLFLSFDSFWKALEGEKYPHLEKAPEFYGAIILTAAAAWLFYKLRKGRPFGEMKPIEPVFLLFAFIFLIGMKTAFAVVLINIIIFGVGIMTIREGEKRDHLGILNYGLLIIAALVICRFFDTDLSFVARGVLFMLVGAGFFVANNRMLKKRKAYEQ